MPKRRRRYESGGDTGGERDLVERIARHFGKRAAGFVSLGMGDDAALVRPAPGNEIILTCDWFLEGTHFLRDRHPAEAVGWKCLARAVSDVAAMGGVPRCFLLSLALPEPLTGSWLDAFLRGLRRAARRFRCELAGGDTTSRREVLINITVAGEVRRGRASRRSGARPGDILYVSGRLGEAELGLKLLREGNAERPGQPALLRLADAARPGQLARLARRDMRVKKHLYPEPRLALGRWLREKRLPTAMMDLSDGLSSDLPRMCDASGVGALIDAARLPLPRVHEQEQKRGLDALQLALHGGDDYELLFAVSQRNASRVPASLAGLRITPIGKIVKARQVHLLDRAGRTSVLHAAGWDPFRRV